MMPSLFAHTPPSISTAVCVCSVLHAESRLVISPSLHPLSLVPNIHSSMHTHTESCHPSPASSSPCLITCHIGPRSHLCQTKPNPSCTLSPLPVAHVGFLIRWMQEAVLLSSGWRGLEGVLHTFTKLFFQYFSPLSFTFWNCKYIHIREESWSGPGCL